jgi:hypothetical protein
MNKMLLRITYPPLHLFLIVAMNSPLAHAGSSKYTAKRFMNGGTFCFAQGEQIPGEIKTVKMVVSHAKGGTPNEIAHVDALMHGAKLTGSSVSQSYFDKVSGAATIAPPNNDLDPQQNPQLQIDLTGTSYGTDATDRSNPGVWRVDYAVSLSTTDLTGRIYGVAEFNTVQNGHLGKSAKYAFDEELWPIPCDEFLNR